MKTTHRLTGAVAKQITRKLKEELMLTHWHGLATDGSSDGCSCHLAYCVLEKKPKNFL